MRTLKKYIFSTLILIFVLTILYFKGGVIGQRVVGFILSVIGGLILAILFYFFSGDYKERKVLRVQEKPERITPKNLLTTGIIMVIGSIFLSFILPNIEEQVLPLINLGIGALGIIFIFNALSFYPPK